MYDCSICLDNFNNQEIVKLDCNHIFHFDCLKNIKTNSFPNCRRKIVNDMVCRCSNVKFFYTPLFKKNVTCRFCKKNHLNFISKI